MECSLGKDLAGIYTHWKGGEIALGLGRSPKFGGRLVFLQLLQYYIQILKAT